MLTRQFKNTSIAPSLLGFGMMRLPVTNPKTQEIDEELAVKMIDEAICGGVNYFDTAYCYHEGLSESFAGRALSRYPRDSYYLASKMPSWLVNAPEDVERIFQEQLKRCRTEYFDFYLVHNITENKLERIETLKIHEYLMEMKRQGKIRRLGFSFHDRPEVLRDTVNRYEWEFAQIQLNYLDWEHQQAREQYQILTDAGLPVIVMEPLRGGALVSLCQEALLILHETNPNVSPAGWGLRFVASLPNVLTILSGMSTLEQVQDNIKTLSNFQPLSETEQETLQRALDAYRKASPVPCTACRYCMDCPYGVDIPKTLAIYNHYLFKKASFSFLQECTILGADKLPTHCIGCGKCAKICPQKIEIPRLMKEISEMIEKFERPEWLKR